jgi:hypothetical protein
MIRLEGILELADALRWPSTFGRNGADDCVREFSDADGGIAIRAYHLEHLEVGVLLDAFEKAGSVSARTDCVRSHNLGRGCLALPQRAMSA